MKLPELFYCNNTCIFTFSLVRGTTLQVLSFSYALISMILPLMKTFLELLLRYSFQCRRHIFYLLNIPKSWSF